MGESKELDKNKERFRLTHCITLSHSGTNSRCINILHGGRNRPYRMKCTSIKMLATIKMAGFFSRRGNTHVMHCKYTIII